jgi:hypothetical protein
MRNIWIFVLLLVPVVGCVHTTNNYTIESIGAFESQYHQELADTEMKGIAVFSFEQNVFQQNDNIYPEILWSMQDKSRKGRFIDHRVPFFFPNGRSKGVFYAMLSPGTYHFHTYKLWQVVGSKRYYVDFSERFDGSFAINAGEIVYLGKIFTDGSPLNQDDKNKNKKIASITVLLNEPDSAKSTLDYYHELTGWPVVTRLMHWRDLRLTDKGAL